LVVRRWPEPVVGRYLDPVVGRRPSANQFYFATGFELIMAAPPEQRGLWPMTNDE
jgi:hypothetical protein